MECVPINRSEAVIISKDKKGISRIVCNDCGKRASFGWTWKKPLKCAQHKIQDMDDVMNKRCEYEGCKTLPIFGNKGKPTHCWTHRKDNMEDVRHGKNQCNHDGCKTRPSYGFQGKKATCCATHAVDGMINVVSQHCVYVGCKILACFGEVHGKAMFCVKHKEPDMVDVLNKLCLHVGCKKQPTFGYEDDEKPIYCFEHQRKGMENVRDKKCQHAGCKTKPTFGIEGGRPTHCKTHKVEGMEDVSNKKCSHEGCTLRPYYGVEYGKPTHCDIHRKEKMENAVSKRCQSENCMTIVKPKFQGYCFRCFIHKFPDQEVSRNYRIKEQHIYNFLLATFPKETIINDKTVQGGCSNRRPDFFIEKFTHALVIECDENGHPESSYSTTCKVARVNELYTDLGDRPIVFIHFNPDSYINEQGIKLPSSFKYHKVLEVPVIRDHKEWESRLMALKEKIEFNLRNIPQKPVTIEHLYFDAE